MQAGEGQREGGRGSRAGPALTAESWMWGTNSRTSREIMPWAKVGRLTETPGCPLLYFLTQDEHSPGCCVVWVRFQSVKKVNSDCFCQLNGCFSGKTNPWSSLHFINFPEVQFTNLCECVNYTFAAMSKVTKVTDVFFFKIIILFFFILSRPPTRHEAWTHNPEIKSCVSYQLSQPDTPTKTSFMLSSLSLTV